MGPRLVWEVHRGYQVVGGMTFGKNKEGTFAGAE